MVGPLVKLAEIRGAELDREGGRKGMRELEGKAAGDERAFIPSTAPGWQMGRLRYRVRQAVRRSRGRYTHPVIHRYVFLPYRTPSNLVRPLHAIFIYEILTGIANAT
jgi:hypothetical protein